MSLIFLKHTFTQSKFINTWSLFKLMSENLHASFIPANFCLFNYCNHKPQGFSNFLYDKRSMQILSN